MKYYRIIHSLDKNKIGSTYPQSQTSQLSFQLDDARYIGKQDIGKRLPQNVLIPEPELDPKARLTDLISSSNSLRLIISERLKHLLEKNVSKEQGEFFPVRVHHNNGSTPYWILNPIKFGMEFINYPISEIWLTDFGFSKISKVHVNDYADFTVKLNELLLPKGLTMFAFSFIERAIQDYIQLRYVEGGVGYYVSEKLKKAIEDEGCTGIAFAPVAES